MERYRTLTYFSINQVSKKGSLVAIALLNSRHLRWDSTNRLENSSLFEISWEVLKEENLHLLLFIYKKIRNHLHETVTSGAKIHSLARKYEHFCINYIQLCGKF